MKLHQSGFGHILIILIVLIILAVAGGGAYFFATNHNVTPKASETPTKSSAPASLDQSYQNPFSTTTSQSSNAYQNPFAQAQNPFENLK